jgi:hypothetical protein
MKNKLSFLFLFLTLSLYSQYEEPCPCPCPEEYNVTQINYIPDECNPSPYGTQGVITYTIQVYNLSYPLSCPTDFESLQLPSSKWIGIYGDFVSEDQARRKAEELRSMYPDYCNLFIIERPTHIINRIRWL